MSYTTYHILENGDLQFTLTESGKEELIELLENVNTNQHTDADAFYKLTEGPMCNGLSFINPEDIGALTDSLIIADGVIDDETPEDAKINVWWFPEYMVKSYLDDFEKQGFVIFTKAPENE